MKLCVNAISDQFWKHVPLFTSAYRLQACEDDNPPTLTLACNAGTAMIITRALYVKPFSDFSACAAQEADVTRDLVLDVELLVADQCVGEDRCTVALEWRTWRVFTQRRSGVWLGQSYFQVDFQCVGKSLSLFLALFSCVLFVYIRVATSASLIFTCTCIRTCRSRSDSIKPLPCNVDFKGAHGERRMACVRLRPIRATSGQRGALVRWRKVHSSWECIHRKGKLIFKNVVRFYKSQNSIGTFSAESMYRVHGA